MMCTISGIRRAPLLLISLAHALLLTACGGGGGGSPPPPASPPPPPARYTIGGTVSGLTGTGLVLQNNGASNLSVSAAGPFTFGGNVAAGSSYAVTVLTQPSSPTQTCVVNNGTGSANANVTNVAVSCASSVDTDGDGLTDDVELSTHRTSPALADTDGDGYSDFREIVELGFDTSVNNFRYNPRIADLPKLKVEILTTPVIGAIFTDTNGSSQNVSTTRSQSTSTSTSTTFGTSVTVGVEATTSATAGGSLSGPTAEVSNSVSVSASSTVSFDQTNTTENQTAWESMRGQGVEQSTATNGGYVRVGVVISNDGHIPFTLQHISLSSTQASDGVDPFLPLATLDYDSAQAFPPTSLAGNQSTGTLIFENSTLDVGTVRTMLTAARSVKIDPAIYQITDVNGQGFAYQEAEVISRTAKVLIDYGAHAESELYQVATNTVPNSPGLSLRTLLDDFLAIPNSSDANGLNGVRSVASGIGRWVVTRKRDGGNELEVLIFDPDIAAYALDGIDVRAGDEVLLVFLEDLDADGIGYREELVHGTNPNAADTDGDGLDDLEEIRDHWTVTAVNVQDPQRYEGSRGSVHSSPVSADYDKDTLDDADEKARGLDPYNPDTDGDGIPDALDNDNGNLPLVSQMLLQIGDLPLLPGDTEHTVYLAGTVTASYPQVVATATVDWETDGTADETYNTAPGGNPTTTIAVFNSYPGPGTFTITLDANDDATTPTTLQETAQAVFTSLTRPVTDAYGWDGGWRIAQHVRTVADLNQDGFDDIVMMSNSITTAMLGSAAGFGAPTTWAPDHWVPANYTTVATDPRFFVDLDNDNDLDVIGVDASANTVRYGLNNGTGFDAPVDWITGIAWNGTRDSAYIVDVDNNGYPDFVHAKTNGTLTVYTTNGANLATTTFASPTAWASGYPNRALYPIEAADLDGNGCTDLVLFGSSETFFNRSLCNGQFAGWQSLITDFAYNQGWRVAQHKRWVEDVTNDGLPDIVGAGTSSVFVLVNQSTPGNVSMSPSTAIWAQDFVSGEGWADNKNVSGRDWFNVHPRYLADVNADGYKDIVGFAGAGAAIGINMLGLDGTAAFSDVSVVATGFAIGGAEWFQDYSCPSTGTCRELFPRLVGDVDKDGRADLIGFDQDNVVLQLMPYVTQLQ